MLQPHVLPTAADLVRLALIGLVAALTAGIGLLAGARRLETAFFAGWGAVCLIAVLAGTWSPLDLVWVMALAGLLGAAGWVRWLLHPTTASLGPALRVTALGAPFVLLVLGMAVIAWDDFAFWLPNLLHLCVTHRFPSLTQPAVASVNPAYPYGIALAGFAVHLLGGGDVETVGLVWNLLAMFAAGAAFAGILAERLRAQGVPLAGSALWGIAALGAVLMGMANPTFVAKITLSNMGDSATGAGLAVLCAELIAFAAQPRSQPLPLRVLAGIALTCCTIVFIRQANAALLIIVFLSAAAGLALFQDRLPSRALAALVLALLPAAVLSLSWTQYAHQQIPNGSHYVLPFAAWHWPLFGRTLRAAGHVLIAKAGYSAMAFAMGGIAVHAILRRKRAMAAGPYRQAAATIAVVTAGLAFGNMAFLLFCYLATSFYPAEVVAAISFWRFIGQTGQSLMIGLVCVAPIAWLRPWLQRRWLPGAMAAAVLLLPLAAIQTYRDDLTSPAPGLRRIAEDLRHAVPDDGPLVLVDPAGNGFAPLVATYQLKVVDGDQGPLTVLSDPAGLSPAQVQAMLPPSARDIWLAEGSPALAGVLGVATSRACSYLLLREAGTMHIYRTWAVGPWSGAERDPTPASRCAG